MSVTDFTSILAGIQNRIQNSAPAFRAITDLMVSSAQQNFETEGRPTQWAPLAAATRKFKEKHGWTKILMRSGDLRASIVGSDTPSNDSATIGSNKVFAQIQNDGGTIEMPARAYKTRHRTDAKGNLLHQGASGKLLIFAKASHKRVLERTFTGDAYTITIPGRPFLVVQDSDVKQYNGILYRYWFEGELTR